MVRNGDGGKSCVIAMMQDITQRKEAVLRQPTRPRCRRAYSISTSNN